MTNETDVTFAQVVATIESSFAGFTTEIKRSKVFKLVTLKVFDSRNVLSGVVQIQCFDRPYPGFAEGPLPTVSSLYAGISDDQLKVALDKATDGLQCHHRLRLVDHGEYNQVSLLRNKYALAVGKIVVAFSFVDKPLPFDGLADAPGEYRVSLGMVRTLTTVEAGMIEPKDTWVKFSEAAGGREMEISLTRYTLSLGEKEHYGQSDLPVYSTAIDKGKIFTPENGVNCLIQNSTVCEMEFRVASSESSEWSTKGVYVYTLVSATEKLQFTVNIR